MDPLAQLDDRFSGPGAVATPWERTRQVLVDAELFWVSTVRRDGRPHVAPLTAVWSQDVLYFCTGPREQKALNLAANDLCALTTGDNRWKAGLDVVVEGRARRVTEDALLRRLAAAWESKYHGDWHFDVAGGSFHNEGEEVFVFAVAPTKVLAFAKGDFAQTRYRFARLAR